MYLAEKLERGMGKHEGWMDDTHRNEWDQSHIAGTEVNAHIGPDIRSLCPVISWVQAGEWMEIAEGYQPQYGQEITTLPRQLQQRFLCPARTRHQHGTASSMTGDLIFVDPHVDPIHGKYVVVMIEDTAEATFKQLIVEEGRQYLKALNPEWPNPDHRGRPECPSGVVVFDGAVA